MYKKRIPLAPAWPRVGRRGEFVACFGGIVGVLGGTGVGYTRDEFVQWSPEIRTLLLFGASNPRCVLNQCVPPKRLTHPPVLLICPIRYTLCAGYTTVTGK